MICNCRTEDMKKLFKVYSLVQGDTKIDKFGYSCLEKKIRSSKWVGIKRRSFQRSIALKEIVCLVLWVVCESVKLDVLYNYVYHWHVGKIVE